VPHLPPDGKPARDDARRRGEGYVWIGQHVTRKYRSPRNPLGYNLIEISIPTATPPQSIPQYSVPEAAALPTGCRFRGGSHRPARYQIERPGCGDVTDPGAMRGEKMAAGDDTVNTQRAIATTTSPAATRSRQVLASGSSPVSPSGGGVPTTGGLGAVAAAVNGHVGTGDEGRARGSQKSDEFGDLARFADPTQHGGHGEVVEHFPFACVGIHRSRLAVRLPGGAGQANSALRAPSSHAVRVASPASSFPPSR
jgi:hypothetical protein